MKQDKALRLQGKRWTWRELGGSGDTFGCGQTAKIEKTLLWWRAGGLTAHRERSVREHLKLWGTFQTTRTVWSQQIKENSDARRNETISRHLHLGQDQGKKDINTWLCVRTSKVKYFQANRGGGGGRTTKGKSKDDLRSFQKKKKKGQIKTPACHCS